VRTLAVIRGSITLEDHNEGPGRDPRGCVMKPAYRAWIKPEKKMAPVTGWMTAKNGEELIQVAGGRWVPATDCLLMQGTGMMDLRSELDEEPVKQEIFEGDILLWSYDGGDEDGSEWIDCHETVRYSNRHAWWYLSRSREDDTLSHFGPGAVVVGNIYANPEIIAKIEDPRDRQALEQELKEKSPEDAIEYFTAFGTGE